jgi:hypothetical protein
MQIFE